MSESRDGFLIEAFSACSVSSDIVRKPLLSHLSPTFHTHLGPSESIYSWVPGDCGEDGATPAMPRLPEFQNWFEGDLQDTFFI